jgi:hypothetical protein
VLDPDGNNIEAVWHGDTTRSAESVLVERKGLAQPSAYPPTRPSGAE